MALYENSIRIKGFLGKNAATKSTKQSKQFTILSVATKPSYKDKHTGEWVSHTDWHRIVLFGALGELARQFNKGDYVQIEGELRSSEYDTETGGKQTKRRVWEVRADRILKLDRPANPDAEPVGDGAAA